MRRPTESSVYLFFDEASGVHLEGFVTHPDDADAPCSDADDASMDGHADQRPSVDLISIITTVLAKEQALEQPLLAVRVSDARNYTYAALTKEMLRMGSSIGRTNHMYMYQ